ncbi:MAG: DUF2585 domain-containing protein [bacterium]|nr:DUF2585 domain-containing protein [bacterium]
MKFLQNITWKKLLGIIIVLLIVHAGILYFMGQVSICKCGYVNLWQGVVASSENSQHISDWYTFSHIIHGFVFYFVLWLINKKWPIPWKKRLIMAIFLEGAWEIFENTDLIINRYRDIPAYRDYFGDSIINSVSDIIAMILGFLAARKMPVWITVLLMVAMEIFVGLSIRDNLTLNVIMLIYPVEALMEWQAGG